MIMQLIDADTQWIKQNYPDLLENNSSKFRLAGMLKFSMSYDKENEKGIINPPTPTEPQQIHIVDQYEVEIDFTTVEQIGLPLVLETGSRLKNVAEQRGLNSADIHCFKDWQSCLCFDLEIQDYLPNGFNIQDFFYYLLIPYFYAQSYFERYEEWPWGEYAHGIFGFFEWYFRTDSQETEEVFRKSLLFLRKQKEWELCKELLHSKREIKGHRDCICGLKSKFRDCHPEVFQGIWKIKNDIKKFKIKLQ